MLVLQIIVSCRDVLVNVMFRSNRYMLAKSRLEWLGLRQTSAVVNHVLVDVPDYLVPADLVLSVYYHSEHTSIIIIVVFVYTV